MTQQMVGNPDIKLAIAGDVYKIQRRPMHNHIVINNGYQGLRVIDPWTGNDVLGVDFTKDYDNSGIVDEWCFRADGQVILVLNEESRAACWLSLEGGGLSYDLKCPPLNRLIDLRYLWEGDSFWITGGKSYSFFQLQWQDSVPAFVESSGIKARIAHRAWRQALDRLPDSKCNVLRVESDKSQILYHHFSEKPGRVGAVSWHHETMWSAPAPEEVPRLAFHEGRMFVLHEYEAHSLNEQGQVEAVYPVPQGFHYSDLDTVPAQNDYPAALVLVCSSLADPQVTQLLVYRLDN
jgi:hypothetical protein